jgi:hypothetical protein
MTVMNFFRKRSETKLLTKLKETKNFSPAFWLKLSQLSKYISSKSKVNLYLF